MYEVSDSYQRFDQKNNMMMRPIWDPDVKHIIPTNMETRLRHIERGEKNTTGFGLKEFALALSSGLISSSLGTDINQPNCGLTSLETIPFPSSSSATHRQRPWGLASERQCRQ
jgi:hypothetical protein